MRAFVFTLGLLASAYAGTLHDTLEKSFASDSDKKDAIVEFSNPMLDSVLNHPDLAGLSGNARKTKIVTLLKKGTQEDQSSVVNAFSHLGIESSQVKAFWGANRVHLKDVSLRQVQAVAALPGTHTVREPQTVTTLIEEGHSISKRQAQAQWGVAKINATRAWAAGNTGEGVVIGILDTGCFVQHEALQSRYLNTPYAWHDAVAKKTSPYDDNGHGTHCAGTALGDKNGIGVAPGAKLMCCKALDSQGSASEDTLLECGQFFACPAKDSAGNCYGHPHISSNSWGTSQGGQTFYNDVVKLWQSVGIIPVFAAGNSGPMCFSLGSPGDEPNLIGVAATNPQDQLADFSSRGPSSNGLQKPDVAAPGTDIVSASNTNATGYRTMSGTSMATPHVAGTTALILSRHPAYTYKDVWTALTKTTVKPKLGFLAPLTTCTLSFNVGYPNNGYGYGRIDAFSAQA